MRPLVLLALFAFAFYVAWNAYWLSRGVLPPSILKGVLGVPAPTTGMTRSCRALLAGNPAEAVCWNAFTLPILGLYMASLTVFVRSLCSRRRVVLPVPMVWLWGILLTGAWIVKLVQGPAWW